MLLEEQPLDDAMEGLAEEEGDAGAAAQKSNESINNKQSWENDANRRKLSTKRDRQDLPNTIFGHMKHQDSLH